MKIRLNFCLFLTTALVLGGCLPALRSQDQQPAQSESLLEASNAPDPHDPLQEHLRARSRVNPNDLNSSVYTTEGHAPQEAADIRIAHIEDENNTQALKINPKPDIAAAPVQEQPVTKVVASAAPAGGVSVTGVRTGDHPGKTRLVFDLTGPSGYSYKIDNVAQVLRIEMTNANWSAAPETKLAGRLVRSYSASALQGGGSVVEIRLASPAKLLTSVALPPNEIYGHRVYFDLAGL